MGMGSVGQNPTFSEHSHVVSNLRDSRMQKHGSTFFACRPPPSTYDPRGRGQKVKVHFFQSMAKLHIKLKGISNMVANSLPPDPPCSHPDPGDGVNRSKFDLT